MEVENGQGFPHHPLWGRSCSPWHRSSGIQGNGDVRSHTTGTNCEPGWMPSLSSYPGLITLLKQCPLQKDNYFPYFVALLTTEIQPHSLGLKRKYRCYGCFQARLRGIPFWMVSELQCWAIDIPDIVGHSGVLSTRQVQSSVIHMFYLL